MLAREIGGAQFLLAVALSSTYVNNLPMSTTGCGLYVLTIISTRFSKSPYYSITMCMAALGSSGRKDASNAAMSPEEMFASARNGILLSLVPPALGTSPISTKFPFLNELNLLASISGTGTLTFSSPSNNERF
jgi:hypothetical protein